LFCCLGTCREVHCLRAGRLIAGVCNWQAWAGVDVAALAQYLTHTLRSGQAFDLLLLKELVSVMTVRTSMETLTHFAFLQWQQSTSDSGPIIILCHGSLKSATAASL
jgi:hypothetical protein